MIFSNKGAFKKKKNHVLLCRPPFPNCVVSHSQITEYICINPSPINILVIYIIITMSLSALIKIHAIKKLIGGGGVQTLGSVGVGFHLLVC